MADSERTDPGSQIVFTTLPDAEAARSLVRDLVAERIVACGTVLEGVASIYRWKGEIAEEREALVLLKTVPARWPDLVAAIDARHPYEVPELLAVPVGAGLPRYVEWLVAETDTSTTNPIAEEGP